MFQRMIPAILFVAALHGTALAEETSSAAQKTPYLLPYVLVILGVGLGMLFVCRSSRRAEKVKMDDSAPTKYVPEQFSPTGVPVISVGMRMDQVTKSLGKPKISRKGSEIFVELYQAGKLDEDEAAKVHTIYEHEAGRYELVFLRKQVVQIKTQPETKTA